MLDKERISNINHNYMSIHAANILSVQVSKISLQELLHKISSIIDTRERAIITHVHVMGLNIAYETKWFRDFLNNSTLVYCDGMGVKLGSILLNDFLPNRFTLEDWFDDLAHLAETHQYSLFFLGNPPGVAKIAVEKIQHKYPDLKIAGTYHGFFDKNIDSIENKTVIKMINQAKPDILLVGFGMPTQEAWLAENWNQLDVYLAITCGALFEYVAEKLPRGPSWLTQNYLEWIVRIFISPRRYFLRYFKDNPKFIFRILKQRFTGKDHL